MTLDRATGSHGPSPHQGPHDELHNDDDVRTTARDSDTSHAAWSALADELIAALAALDRSIEMRARTAEGTRDQDRSQGRSLDAVAADAAIDAGLEGVRSHLHQGTGRAAAQLGHLAQAATHSGQDGEITATWGDAHRLLFDHPLVQLAQAYGAAFGAVEAATASLARTPATHVPGAAARLVELAVRSAKGLRQAMDLAFGQQGLGTVQHLCDHIATLENQADALYYSAVATYLSRQRAAGQAARWTAEDAEHIRRLATLEALTDRCEEIAEALLLAEHLL